MKDRRGLIAGIILISLGFAFLLEEVFDIDIFDLIFDFWPLILILIGWHLISKNRKKVNGEQREFHAEINIDSSADPSEEKQKTGAGNDWDYSTLNESAVIGDISLRVTSKTFRGGSMKTVIGDIHLNLSEIDTTAGEKAIDISGVVGDVHVTLPNEFVYRIRGNSIIGDISLVGEKTGGMFRHLNFRSENYSSGDKQLNINISLVIGDIHVS